jgi:CHAT domain-containing protein/Tfp pilus assembly protein PilF
MPFILSIFILLVGCVPKTATVKVRESGHGEHYMLYENFSLKTTDSWIKTDIQIQEGAVVALMAKGIARARTYDLKAFSCVRFKIGLKGQEIPLFTGWDLQHPTNSNVIKAGRAGALYYRVSDYLYGSNLQSYIAATVVVWDRQHQDQIERDVQQIIYRDFSKNQQFNYILSYLPSCFFRAGEYEQAEKHLKLRRYHGSTWAFMVSSANEYELGRYDKAKDYAETAVEAARKRGNKLMLGSALRHLARALTGTGEHQKAIRVSEETVKLGKEINNEYFVAYGSYWLGYNHLIMDNPSSGLKHTREALEYFLREEYDPIGSLPLCYVNLGLCRLRLKRTEKAKKSFRNAIEEAAKWFTPEPLWKSYSELGKIAENEGNRQEALKHYAEAINVIESMRGKLSDRNIQARFIEDKLHVYEWMIRLLLRMKKTPEALHYVERAKARVMLDMLQDKAFSSKDENERELLKKERYLRRKIHQGPTGSGLIAPGSQTDTKELIRERKRLHSKHRAILDKIEKLNPELASLISINPLKAAEIQKMMDLDSVLLEYFVGQESQLVFVVTQEKVLAVPLEKPAQVLFEMIRNFRRSAAESISLELLSSKDYQNTLKDLGNLLIQPIRQDISGKKHLVIVPHGMLHYLPFHALRFQTGKYLIEDYAISYLPSASVLEYARMKNKGNRNDIFAAGNPKTDLAPLPAAEEEAKSVSGLFENRLLLTGQMATEASVKAKCPGYDMILLSTHGEMLDSQPLKSNLRFAKSEDDDGKLTVDEIFDMEIEANLVTLSACETGLAKGQGKDFPRGDDLVGLSRAFIHAGAPTVVGSLWKVSDNSTVELIRSFYKNLQNMSKAEALRKAQLDLMNSKIQYTLKRGGRGITISPGYKAGLTIDCSHPYFWAPFILVGDWR